jgi:hypothetical protein
MPSNKKVRFFLLALSVIGIIVCSFLLVRAYVYQEYGFRFTYADFFIDEKLFQGYENTVIMYMSYLLQGVALNSSVIEKYSDKIGKISKFLMFISMFLFCPSSWFYCGSMITEFKGTGYSAASVLGVCMTLNIFSASDRIRENLFQESAILIGCILAVFLLFVNSFIVIEF